MIEPLSNTQAPAENLASQSLESPAPSGDAESSVITRISMEAAQASILPAGTFLKNPNHTCCIGIDVPGVGHIHAYTCPAMERHVRSAARPYIAGEVPEPLKSFVDGDEFDPELSAADFEIIRHAELVQAERDRLLTQLLFAARNLAEANIIVSFRSHETGKPLSCRECHFGATSDGTLRHARSCNTGHTFDILAALMATLSFDPNQKEAATDGGTDRAGDGIRPHGIRLIEAAKALRQAALEEMVQLGSRLTWQCNACGSSVTGSDKTERDIVHGCDCWVGNALTVLSSDDLEGGAR